MAVDETRKASDSYGVSELAELVRAEAARSSYPQMVKRATDRGLKLSVSGLQQIGVGKIKRPRPETLPALAYALRMTETQVREAAARQGGVHVEHNVPFRTGQMLSRVEHMSPVNRDRWFRLAQAIADTLAAEEPSAPDSVVLTESGRVPDVVTEKATDRLTAEAVERAERTRRRRRQA